MPLNEDIAHAAETIVNTLTQTDYQHKREIDPSAGVYRCDCNGFVGFVLENVAPAHYEIVLDFKNENFPGESGQIRPRAFVYYGFFASLTPDSAGGWSRVDFLKDARRGDIIAWREPLIEKDENTGHLVIVAEAPTLHAEGYYSLRVYDSAASPHFEDTRPNVHTPPLTDPPALGVGSGFINFLVDADGSPIAYLFSPPIDADYSYKTIAIGRVKAIE